jgi:hypothetical protein
MNIRYSIESPGNGRDEARTSYICRFSPIMASDAPLNATDDGRGVNAPNGPHDPTVILAFDHMRINLLCYLFPASAARNASSMDPEEVKHMC